MREGRRFLEGFLNNALRCEDLLTSQSEPRIRAVALVEILHVACGNFILVRDIEEVAEHLHFISLLALAHK